MNIDLLITTLGRDGFDLVVLIAVLGICPLLAICALLASDLLSHRHLERRARERLQARERVLYDLRNEGLTAAEAQDWLKLHDLL